QYHMQINSNSHNLKLPLDDLGSIGFNYKSGLNLATIKVGFAFAHVSNPSSIITNDYWQEFTGPLKTDTVLRYDQYLKNIEAWRLPVLVQKPVIRRTFKSGFLTIQFFKLHLSKKFDKPDLPEELYYKKAITDYLTEMAKAAAIYCKRILQKQQGPIVILDCSSYKIDFITFMLKNNELKESGNKITEFTGGAWVDKEFLKFLKKNIRESAIISLAKEYTINFNIC
ncbi:4398_t:CDS:2, partial [Racocetra persica]